MAIRRSLVATWLFFAAILSGQTVEELRAKLAQADIDKAVMAERARNSSDHPTSAVLIALIGALPALYAAYLSHVGNRMIDRATSITQNMGAKSTAENKEIAKGLAQNKALSEDIKQNIA